MEFTCVAQGLDGSEAHFIGMLPAVQAWLDSLDMPTFAGIHIYPNP